VSKLASAAFIAFVVVALIGAAFLQRRLGTRLQRRRRALGELDAPRATVMPPDVWYRVLTGREPRRHIRYIGDYQMKDWVRFVALAVAIWTAGWFLWIGRR
jgi:hypothetical protein